MKRTQPGARRHESWGPGMYVIFPADELIYMTYGAALPRIKPRPTLDNLREPLVPIRSPSASNARNESHAVQSYPVPSPRKNSNSSRTSAKLPQSNNNNNTNTNNNNNDTDVFGYKSTYIDSRTRSPSIVIEPSTPGATYPSSSSQQHHLLQQQISVDKQSTSTAAPAKPAKSKHRLHLRLGNLGRSKQTKTPEPARLRDVTDIHIANPAFTRENLVQRNYDAFFESGEPVYSLEHRAPPQPEPEPEPPPELDSSHLHSHRPHSLGFFHKSPKNSRSGGVSSSGTTASSAGGKFRSKSAEIVESVEVPQKGDRCPS